MSNELVLNAANYGIEKSKAEQIEAVFVPMVDMLKKFEGAYSKVVDEAETEITREVVGAAKRVRLDISKVRIKTEKARKEQKEEYLRAGKAIDGIANILKFAVVEKEEKLKEIETYYERIEAEKIEKLQQDRMTELEKYIDEPINIDLASMTEEVWTRYLEGYKLAYEKRIEAEKKAEEERIKAEEAEKERLRKIEEENERLKKEAEERERLRRIEEEKQKKEREALKKKLEKERKEREAAEKAEAEKRAKEAEEREKAQREKDRIEAEKRAKEKAEQEKILQKEREEKERLEAELETKRQADLKAQQEKEEREKALRLAPDKDKLLQLAATIQGVELPIVKNKEAQTILKQVRDRLERTYLDLIEQSEKL